MSIRIRKYAGIAAILASATFALPAQAAQTHAPVAGAVGHWSAADETVHGWRSRGGWGGYYGGNWGRHGHVRGGDVLAGILIVGGALAVVKAIENSNDRRYRANYPDRDYRDRDYRYPDYRDRDTRYPDYRDNGRDYRDPRDSRYDGDPRRGIDGAIEDCVGEVQRDSRVATVDTAERNEDGWRVAGDLARGGRYSCKFGNDGRVRDIDIDMGRSSSRDEPAYEARRDDDRAYEVRRDDAGRDSQYDDDYYASARERMGDQAPDIRSAEAPPVDAPDMAAPAEDGDRSWQRGEADDRYDTAAASGDYALARK